MDITEARTAALELMTRYGLIYKGWKFQFDRSKRRCGMCRHGRRIISLGRSYASLNREELVRDTILHEIAHALVGPGHGHDSLWKLKAREIGAMPVRCKDVHREAIVQPKTDWTGRCTDCGVTFARFRPPKLNGAQYWHSLCRRKPNRGAITWYYKGVARDDFGRVMQESIAADQPAQIESKPSQAQINELWARLNKLEEK